MYLMERLRRWLGGSPLREIDERTRTVRDEQHARINQMQPWERDRFTERQWQAWRERRPQLDDEPLESQ